MKVSEMESERGEPRREGKRANERDGGGRMGKGTRE